MKSFFLICIILMSCKASKKNNAYNCAETEDWTKKVYELLDQETLKTKDCLESELLVKKCKRLIQKIDFQHNIITLDSLRQEFEDNNDVNFVIINNFQSSFNFWSCTTFLVSHNNNRGFNGFEKCNIYIDPLDPIEPPEANIAQVHYNYKEVKKYFNLTTDCELNGIYIITWLDRNLKIKRIHVAVMPSA